MLSIEIKEGHTIGLLQSSKIGSSMLCNTSITISSSAETSNMQEKKILIGILRNLKPSPSLTLLYSFWCTTYHSVGKSPSSTIARGLARWRQNYTKPIRTAFRCWALTARDKIMNTNLYIPMTKQRNRSSLCCSWITFRSYRGNCRTSTRWR